MSEGEKKTPDVPKQKTGLPIAFPFLMRSLNGAALDMEAEGIEDAAPTNPTALIYRLLNKFGDETEYELLLKDLRAWGRALVDIPSCRKVYDERLIPNLAAIRMAMLKIVGSRLQKFEMAPDTLEESMTLPFTSKAFSLRADYVFYLFMLIEAELQLLVRESEEIEALSADMKAKGYFEPYHPDHVSDKIPDELSGPKE